MHNNHCVKWSCAPSTSTTAGRCEGQYYGCDKVTVNLSYQRQGQSHTENILASFINTETLQFTLGGRRFEMQCGSKSSFQQNPTATYSGGIGCIWEEEFDDNLNALGISNFHIHSVKCSASSCNAGKTESSCKSQSSTCTRKPGTSSTTQGHVCYREGETSPVAEHYCSGLVKPSCGANEQGSSNITIDVKLLPNTNPRNKCHESRDYQVTINNPNGQQLKISTITSITNGYGGTIYGQQDYNNSNMSNTSHQFIVKTGYSGDVGIIIKGNILITIESEGKVTTKQINFTLKNPEDVFGKPCDAF